jgi:integrase
MAGVKKDSKSPYWIATLRVWKPIPHHREGGIMAQTRLSTKVPISEPKAVAKRVADELERIRREGAPGGPMKTDKSYFNVRVAALMRAAGIEPPSKETTWREFSKRWLDEQREHKAAVRSIEKYTDDFDLFTAFLGPRSRLPLSDVTYEDLKDFHAGLIAEGRTATTAQMVVKNVRAVLKRAVLFGYLESNPADLVKLKSGSVIQKQPFSRADVKEVFEYIESLEKNDPLREWRTACLFGLNYGMRINDAVHRSGEEIEEFDGIPILKFVPHKKKRKGVAVSLPLIGELVELPRSGPLTPHLAKIKSPSKSFGKLLANTKIHINRAKATGKGRKTGDKSFHSFRHSANSFLSDAGVDVRIRQLICDHDDLKTSMKYTHSSVEAMAAAIRKAIPTPT